MIWTVLSKRCLPPGWNPLVMTIMIRAGGFTFSTGMALSLKWLAMRNRQTCVPRASNSVIPTQTGMTLLRLHSDKWEQPTPAFSQTRIHQHLLARCFLFVGLGDFGIDHIHQ